MGETWRFRVGLDKTWFTIELKIKKPRFSVCLSALPTLPPSSSYSLLAPNLSSFSGINTLPRRWDFDILILSIKQFDIPITRHTLLLNSKRLAMQFKSIIFSLLALISFSYAVAIPTPLVFLTPEEVNRFPTPRYA